MFVPSGVSIGCQQCLQEQFWNNLVRICIYVNVLEGKLEQVGESGQTAALLQDVGRAGEAH